MMRFQSNLVRAVWPVCFATAFTAQTPGPAAAELLALRTPATLTQWMRAHPADTFRRNLNSGIEEKLLVNGTWCGVARRQFTLDLTLITRRAFFHPPGANDLRLPPDDGPHPELTDQCVLGEVLVESESGSQELEAALSRIQADIAQKLGDGQVFRADLREHYPLWGSARWRNGKEWRNGGSRWVVAWNSESRTLIAVALTAATEESAAAGLDQPLRRELENAQRFAADAGLPTPEIRRMQALLRQAKKWQLQPPPKDPPSILSLSPFLVRWIQQSRHLPPTKRASGLYAADVALASIPLYVTPDTRESLSQPQLKEKTTPVRTELAAAGASFEYDELGGAYTYRRDWMQQAFQSAPDSEAGQQAFLYLLNSSFHPSCCCAGQEEGFEEIIKRAPRDLDQHPSWTIRGDVLLAIGDAYRDIIAIANGSNGDPYGDAAKFKPRTKQAYHNALRYYRASFHAAPRSRAAKEALLKAWTLQLGLPPLETRFACLYD